jgi:NMD protein affecting ribosome stability and mRNA decay
MRTRLSLVHYDLLRELCESCRRERFHFVPIGAVPATAPCRQCGKEGRMADLSDSSIYRLVTQPNGEMVVVPLIGG